MGVLSSIHDYVGTDKLLQLQRFHSVGPPNMDKIKLVLIWRTGGSIDVFQIRNTILLLRSEDWLNNLELHPKDVR